MSLPSTPNTASAPPPPPRPHPTRPRQVVYGEDGIEDPKGSKWATEPCAQSLLPTHRGYLMMLEASSASGSAQYLLARMRHASADSI